MILLSAEDDLETTVANRLVAAGADRLKIFTLEVVDHTSRFVDGRRVRPFTLADIPPLEQAIRATRDVKLVVIDPVTAYVGHIDDHRSTEVRAALAPLHELARRHALTVLLVTHLNKNGNGRALTRVMGSLAYTAAPRAAYALVKDRDDASRRLLLPMKANQGPDNTGLAFRIDGATLKLVWEPALVRMTAEEALADPEEHKAAGVDRAREFLREFVGERPIRATAVFDEAKRRGIPEATLRRAKRVLRIESFQAPDAWYWRVPQADDDPEVQALPPDLEPLDRLIA